jgi:hypothetical protein
VKKNRIHHTATTPTLQWATARPERPFCGRQKHRGDKVWKLTEITGSLTHHEEEDFSRDQEQHQHERPNKDVPKGDFINKRKNSIIN